MPSLLALLLATSRDRAFILPFVKIFAQFQLLPCVQQAVRYECRSQVCLRSSFVCWITIFIVLWVHQLNFNGKYIQLLQTRMDQFGTSAEMKDTLVIWMRLVMFFMAVTADILTQQSTNVG